MACSPMPVGQAAAEVCQAGLAPYGYDFHDARLQID